MTATRGFHSVDRRPYALRRHSGFPCAQAIPSCRGIMQMERRLAAILAADVVGYSRLMEADEVGVLEMLKAHREELINPGISRHHGTIVKLMGDGSLVEFASVVDAVECALAVQRGMAERNAQAPDERRIDLRIGVHLGDVIVEARTSTATG